MSVIPENSVGDGQNGVVEDSATSSKTVVTLQPDGPVSSSLISTAHLPSYYCIWIE